MKDMNSATSAKSASKTSLTGFVRFCWSDNRTMFVLYVVLAAAILGFDCVYALSRPISAGYLAVAALFALTMLPWAKYEKSLSK
jgi:hypothetical protein